MTTAARPTWAPAKGGEEQGGARMFGPSQKYSSRDLASHNKLKLRKEGQDSKEEVKKRNLRDELEVKERRHFSSRDKHASDERKKGSEILQIEGIDKRVDENRFIPKSIDADESDDEKNNEEESEDEDEDDDDDDEDDTAELLAELERIKKERAEEKIRKEKQQQEAERKTKEGELIRGNPLMNSSATFDIKRRWDDDVVFRNQNRGEAKVTKRFINDTIRSDFHRKFLNKYCK